MDDGIEIRLLRTQDERRACLELQRRTWGPDFEDVAPPMMQMIAEMMGGIAAGAFDGSGRLLGFVFGISGLRNGELAHWSDMCAVAPEARDRGLGRRLKAFQRARMLELGIKVMFWTFDPLVARNAHLNLRVLGARVDEYVEDMYGASESALHRGLGTDRFIVRWDLEKGSRPAEVLPERREAPRLERPRDPLPDRFRVAVPRDVHALIAGDPDAGLALRRRTRALLAPALREGWRVLDFLPDAEGGSYLLSREPEPVR